MPMMPGYVDGPPAQPQRGGLLPAAFEGPNTPGPDGAPAWLKGVQDWPENAAGWRVVQDFITGGQVGDDVMETYGELDTDPYPVASRPVMLQTKVEGPRFGRGSDLQSALRGRVERRLDAVASQAVAREMWTGTLTRQAPYPLSSTYTWANPSPSSGMSCNPFLSDSDNVNDIAPGNPLTPMRALGEVEAATAELVAGGPVMIHCPLVVLTELAWSLERQGPLLLTAKGSIVVPDQGYPGIGPGDTEATADPSMYIYGSGPVMYWLGATDVFDDLDQVVRVSDNAIAMWGQRPFMTLFDPRTLTGCAVTPSTP